MFYLDKPMYILDVRMETGDFAHVTTYSNKHIVDMRRYYYYGLDFLRKIQVIPHLNTFPSKVDFSMVNKLSN